MKVLFVLPVVGVLTSALSGCSADSSADTTPTTSSQKALTRELTPESQFTENGLTTLKQAKIITSQADYDHELVTYTSGASTPLNFTSGKVLLVDMGERGSAGYFINVTTVDVSSTYVVANVTLTKPGSNCLVATVMTNPYEFVYIPTTKEILISESVIVNDC